MVCRGLDIALGLAYALVHLHDIGVVHLNLTLENVQLDHMMRAKASDFSRACVLHGYVDFGPVHYAAPEVFPKGFEVGGPCTSSCLCFIS